MKIWGLIFYRALVLVTLALLTQIGAITYLVGLLIFNRFNLKPWYSRLLAHSAIYLSVTLLVIPQIAPVFGREPVITNPQIQLTNPWLSRLLNRQYVVPELNQLLSSSASRLAQFKSPIVIQVLDTNFPFISGYPLFPHLSHNDGRKLDLSYVYTDSQGTPRQLVPSVSGYGIFEAPKADEVNTTQFCKNHGYFQYDFTRFLTLGSREPKPQFSAKLTKQLIQSILADTHLQKLFIEPHLVKRLGLSDPRIRFQGCRAVRHDDHIHIQI